MLVHAAEEAYQRGRAALDGSRLTEALALFEAAIQVERRQGANGIQPRYLSYYGLCLCIAAQRRREGVHFCREAVAKEEFNPDVHCNLGRALLAVGRRREAFEALARGYRLEPAHGEIRRVLAQMGWRRRPVIPFLSRRNPLNVLLGKTRYSLAGPKPRKNR